MYFEVISFRGFPEKLKSVDRMAAADTAAAVETDQKQCPPVTQGDLTLNVLGPSYLGLTRSISWLLMPWFLTSPGHQQP